MFSDDSHDLRFFLRVCVCVWVHARIKVCIDECIHFEYGAHAHINVRAFIYWTIQFTWRTLSIFHSDRGVARTNDDDRPIFLLLQIELSHESAKRRWHSKGIALCLAMNWNNSILHEWNKFRCILCWNPLCQYWCFSNYYCHTFNRKIDI